MPALRWLTANKRWSKAFWSGTGGRRARRLFGISAKSCVGNRPGGAGGVYKFAEDLNDIYPRKLAYSPRTGRALVKKLASSTTHDLAVREQRYVKSLQSAPAGGEIELF